MNQVASACFFAVGVFVMLEARHLQYESQYGPGPGFFPFWLGLALAGLSVLWFVQASRGPVRPSVKELLPSRPGMLRLASIVGAMVVLAALLNLVGFQLAMFAFLLFLLIALGRQNPGLTLALSLLGSFGLSYVFSQFLEVQLPRASIEFLSDLGL